MMQAHRPRTVMLLALVVILAPRLLSGQPTSPLIVSPLPPTVPGGVRVVTVSAESATRVEARVFERVVALDQVAPGRWQAALGVDLDVKPGSYPVVVTARGPAGAAAEAQTALTVRHRAFPTRQLTVATKFTDPSPAELERIQEEAARVARLWDRRSTPRWDGFRTPTAGMPTSSFGARSIINGQPGAPHAGTDYRGAVGTPVVAPASGRVVMADDLFMTGHTLVIDHGGGALSLLAHLSSIETAVGQDVEAGDLVGRVGATGRVTGPHLHWGVRLLGARVDPLLMLEALPAAVTRR
jgi:hypothetical protein